MGKNLILNFLFAITLIFLSACVNDSNKKDTSSTGGTPTTVNPLKAVNIAPADFDEDTTSLITLSYTDVNSRKAQACSLSSLSKITVSQACACDMAGVCVVGVTGSPNTSGAASFRFNVSIGGEVSSTGTANFTINPIDDAPVTSALSPASFLFNTQSIITLSYSDADGDVATTCSISSLSNVTVTQACACSLSGVCTVGVTGTNNYIGNASFAYTVTANAAVSNSSTASLTIVGNPPVASNISPPSFSTNLESIITLSYTDAQNDQATSCSISNLRYVFLSRPCVCLAGVCTVGVTSNTDYTGQAEFKYTVTAAGQTSNLATASLTITASTPVAANISPPAFNEDVNSVITLSYTDPLSRKATACTIGSATNVSVNQACACDTAGICTVGVKGLANYNGSASFTYTVTAGGQVSNAATATLTINPVDDAPTVTSSILMDLIYEDTQSGYLTLNYTDVDGDRAGVNDCSISNPSNLTVTTACACDVILGNCSLKITGNLHYYGSASFDYKVKTTTLDSNVATASLTILHKDHAPVSTNITPPSFNEETQSIITLAYTDIDNDKAATCSLTSLGNVTVTQACACDGAGVCTVGVTGTSNYSGAGSFYYTVTANGAASNSSTSTFTITNVDDAPVSTNISPPAFDQNTQSIITLAYTDADSDKATACTVGSLVNVSVTQACVCDVAGVCTVGITGSLNYSGAASFAYTVTANAVESNSATASLTINTVNSAPTIAAIAATFGNENTAYVLNFTVSDIDGPLDCATAMTATSTNTALVPVANIVFGGTYPNCSATITPANNIFGSTSLNFKVTDSGGLFSSTAFIHTVRDGVSKTWLLGDAGDTNTYSFGSANIESVAPGVIRLTPLAVDQTDDSSAATGFTALPSTLTWNAGSSVVEQNHTVGAWPLASGVYSASYTSRVLDAKKIVTWNAFAWKTTIGFGKELPLTNESVTDYSLASGTLANSLVGLWHFNESVGATTIKNSKTGVSDSFLLNTPVAASLGGAGQFNMAITMNGDTVIKSTTSSAVTPGAFTLSTWVKKTTANAENVICFWTTDDTTAASDCPVRISTSVRVRIGGSLYMGNTNINDGLWHNVIVISDSLNAETRVYIDGVLETFGTNPPNFTTAGSVLYLGSNIGNAGSFTGSLDETAVWNRVLTSGEASEVYRRGANRLSIAYRTCTDSTCSTNPAWSTTISEQNNVSSGEALTASPNFVISTTNQRFFQYKVTFESDDVPTTSAPDLKSVVVGPVHYAYATTEEEFVTQEGLSFKSLSTFTEILGAQSCSGGGIRYQLSKDKINWSYFNGTVWNAGTNFSTASTPGQIQAGLASYVSSSNTASDTVYVRGILMSDVDGAAPCEVDQLQLTGNE